MSYWNMEPVIAAQKRRGIIEQRTHAYGKKKKVDKPWTVYWNVWGVHNPWRFYPYRFATEELAIRYAEKIRRSNNYPHLIHRLRNDYVWVVNDGADRG